MTTLDGYGYTLAIQSTEQQQFDTMLIDCHIIFNKSFRHTPMLSLNEKKIISVFLYIYINKVTDLILFTPL
jgi:hypothetical protein